MTSRASSLRVACLSVCQSVDVSVCHSVRLTLPYLAFGVSYTLSAEATIMGPMRIPDVPGG